MRGSGGGGGWRLAALTSELIIPLSASVKEGDACAAHLRSAALRSPLRLGREEEEAEDRIISGRSKTAKGLSLCSFSRRKRSP